MHVLHANFNEFQQREHKTKNSLIVIKSLWTSALVGLKGM